MTSNDSKAAGLTDAPQGGISALTDARRTAQLKDVTTEPSSPNAFGAAPDAPSGLDTNQIDEAGTFHRVGEWLAPAHAGEQLRKMERACNDGDLYVDVLGAHGDVDPGSISLAEAQARILEVRRQLGMLRAGGLAQLVNALLLRGFPKVDAALATASTKRALDDRVLKLRETSLLDRVWSHIEPSFSDDAEFDWSEQVLNRKNAPKALTDAHWQMVLARVQTHKLMRNGVLTQVRVQTHAEWITAEVGKEVARGPLVHPRKVQDWVDDLGRSSDPATARRQIERAVNDAGGRIGEPSAANPLMNVRGKSVASPDALVSLCDVDTAARDEVREKLGQGKLSFALENWIEGIAVAADRESPRRLLKVLVEAEQKWKSRDPDLGLKAFLWAAGESRLKLGDVAVNSLDELLVAVDARAARLTPLLASNELEVWLRYARDEQGLANLARDCAARGEVGTWTVLWAAGEKRMRLGRHAAYTLDEFCQFVAVRQEAANAARGALDDTLLGEWLARAQGRPDLRELLEKNRKLTPAVRLWQLLYAAGHKELDVDGVVVSDLVGLVAALGQGRLHAIARALGKDHLRERIELWLAARLPVLAKSTNLDLPLSALHGVMIAGGVHEVWLDDNIVVRTAAALAEVLVASPQFLKRARRDNDFAAVLAVMLPPGDGPRRRSQLATELSAQRPEALGDAAVVRLFGPTRPILVGATSVATGETVTAHAMCTAVLGAIDDARLWSRIEAARLVLQELHMTLRARGSSAAGELQELESALRIDAPASPFPASDVGADDVLNAVFLWRDGQRPFRPAVGGSINTLVELGWHFARNPRDFDVADVAAERALWLAQHGHERLEKLNLCDFLFEVFIARTSATLEVLSAQDERNVVVVSWVLKHTLVLDDVYNNSVERDRGTTPLELPRGFGRAKVEQGEALGAALVAVVAARRKLQVSAIVNAGSVAARIAEERQASQLRRANALQQQRGSQGNAGNSGGGAGPGAIIAAIFLLPAVLFGGAYLMDSWTDAVERKLAPVETPANPSSAERPIRYVATARAIVRSSASDASAELKRLPINSVCAVASPEAGGSPIRNGGESGNGASGGASSSGAFVDVECSGTRGFMKGEYLSQTETLLEEMVGEARTRLANAVTGEQHRDALRWATKAAALELQEPAQQSSHEGRDLMLKAYFGSQLADLVDLRKKNKKAPPHVAIVQCPAAKGTSSCIAAAIQQIELSSWHRVFVRGPDFSAASWVEPNATLRTGHWSRLDGTMTVAVEMTKPTQPLFIPEVLSALPTEEVALGDRDAVWVPEAELPIVPETQMGAPPDAPAPSPSDICFIEFDAGDSYDKLAQARGDVNKALSTLACRQHKDALIAVRKNLDDAVRARLRGELPSGASAADLMADILGPGTRAPLIFAAATELDAQRNLAAVAQRLSTSAKSSNRQLAARLIGAAQHSCGADLLRVIAWLENDRAADVAAAARDARTNCEAR